MYLGGWRVQCFSCRPQHYRGLFGVCVAGECSVAHHGHHRQHPSSMSLFSTGECFVAYLGRSPTRIVCTAARGSLVSGEDDCVSIALFNGECSVASLPRSVPSSPTSCICTKSVCVEQRIVAADCGCSAGNASVAIEDISLCSVASALSRSSPVHVPYQFTKSV